MVDDITDEVGCGAAEEDSVVLVDDVCGGGDDDDDDVGVSVELGVGELFCETGAEIT